MMRYGLVGFVDCSAEVPYKGSNNLIVGFCPLGFVQWDVLAAADSYASLSLPELSMDELREVPAQMCTHFVFVRLITLIGTWLLHVSGCKDHMYKFGLSGD